MRAEIVRLLPATLPDRKGWATDITAGFAELAVFRLAEQRERRLLPRAVIPCITLVSPKITRKLTTECFATRVDERYRRCMGTASRR